MKAPAMQRPRTQHKPSRRTAPAAESASLCAYLPRFFRAIVLALPLCLAAGLALALLGAALLCSLPDPDTPLLPMSLAILLLSALLLGLVIGKRTGERLLLGGLMGGALLLGVMFLMSFPFSSGGEHLLPSSLGLPLRGAVLLFTLLGSYLGGHFPVRSSTRRSKTRR